MFSIQVSTEVIRAVTKTLTLGHDEIMVSMNSKLENEGQEQEQIT